MPITINEMKMPNNCEECEFHQSGYPDWCDLSCRSRDVFNPSIRPDWCPLEEAITVVRCKDCKFFDHSDFGKGEEYWCKHFVSTDDYTHCHKVIEDDFCAWGEKREDA